jgi:CRP/FNR family transcriptional regulator
MIELRTLALFSELDEHELLELTQISSLYQLKKNDIVFYQGDKSDHLYILVEGEAKIYRLDTKGNELILHNFTAPTLLAERANLANIPYPANCKMTGDGKILKIKYEEFKLLMKKSDICFKMMQSLLKKMTSLEDIIDNQILLDVETRVAKFIYENPEAFETLKQHSIANLLNIKPETLSRKLKKLKDLGIIENQSSKLKIVDKEKLSQLFQW